MFCVQIIIGKKKSLSNILDKEQTDAQKNKFLFSVNKANILIKLLYCKICFSVKASLLPQLCNWLQNNFASYPYHLSCDSTLHKDEESSLLLCFNSSIMIYVANACFLFAHCNFVCCFSVLSIVPNTYG